MRIRLAGSMALVGYSIATTCLGQATLQLPTYSSFSVSTSVSVPDRGGIAVAGSGAARSAGAYGGLRASRGFAESRGTAGFAVSAWVHDFEKLDRQALGKTPADRQAPVDNASSGPANVTTASAAPSIRQLRLQRREAAAVRRDQVQKWLDEGRRAERNNQPEMARVLYGMAERGSASDQQSEARRRLAALGASRTRSSQTTGKR